MKKLTSSPTLVTVSHYKNLLASEGIEATINNEHLGGVFGDIPFQDTWPELWVINDLDYDRAKQLIDADIAAESPQAGWRCRHCGTENEGQFAACWQCGKSADS